MRKKLIILFIGIGSFTLFAQQRDHRTREYIAPVRIVWQQDSSQITGANHLLVPGNGQSDLANNRLCVLKSTPTEHPALLLDFGKELQGGPSAGDRYAAVSRSGFRTGSFRRVR